MARSTKVMRGLAFAAALSLSVAACMNPTDAPSSSSGAPSDSTTSGEYWPAATQKLEGVELTFWAAQTSNKIPTKVVEEFEKATGAKVKVETIPDNYESNVQTKIATGETPDLLFWQPVPSTLAGFIAQDKLQPLTDAPLGSQLCPWHC